MYKMLVLDLDGTLLDDYKEIPEINIRAIERLYKNLGVIPVIATARPLEVAEFIASKGGEIFKSYIIATNGAILKDIKNNRYLINESISMEQIKQLVEECKKNNLEYEFMTSECEIADKKFEYRRIVDPMYENMNKPFNFQTNLEEYIMNLNDTIPLFAINGTEEELQECYKCISSIQGLQISEPCTRTTPEKDSEGKLKTLQYFDIMKEGVTKANAIKVLARQLGIKKEEIIAIGDGGNDVEMLQEAGLKIAMKNATAQLKEVADLVTLFDNNNAGVGRSINSIHNVLMKRKTKEQKVKETREDISL